MTGKALPPLPPLTACHWKPVATCDDFCFFLQFTQVLFLSWLHPLGKLLWLHHLKTPESQSTHLYKVLSYFFKRYLLLATNFLYIFGSMFLFFLAVGERAFRGSRAPTVVVVSQPQPVPIILNSLRDSPGFVRCPHCLELVTSNVTYVAGRTAVCSCVIMALMGWEQNTHTHACTHRRITVLKLSRRI